MSVNFNAKIADYFPHVRGIRDREEAETVEDARKVKKLSSDDNSLSSISSSDDEPLKLGPKKLFV